MRKGFVDVAVLKAFSIMISVWVAYFQPYLGGLAGALVFMALKKSDEDFSLRKTWQRVLGGWFLAYILVETLIWQGVIDSEGKSLFTISLIAGFISYPLLKWLLEDGGLKKLGGLLWGKLT